MFDIGEMALDVSTGDLVVGNKALTSINKRLRVIQKNMLRMFKNIKPPKQRSGVNSGFLQLIKVSPELSKFCGWKVGDLKSRVDATTHICKYIKDNDLQYPKDRRNILPDKKLQTLLKYNPVKEDKPLTYYSLQTFLKVHFV